MFADYANRDRRECIAVGAGFSIRLRGVSKSARSKFEPAGGCRCRGRCRCPARNPIAPRLCAGTIGIIPFQVPLQSGAGLYEDQDEISDSPGRASEFRLGSPRVSPRICSRTSVLVRTYVDDHWVLSLINASLRPNVTCVTRRSRAFVCRFLCAASSRYAETRGISFSTHLYRYVT